MTMDIHQGILNNYSMSLPVYRHISISFFSPEELKEILTDDINLRGPIAFDTSEMPELQQKEFVIFLEQFFISKNESFLFPYPIYIIGQIDPNLTKIPVVSAKKDLPKFFSKKESRMNLKESTLANKNKLIQQEIKNADSNTYLNELRNFGETHRIIYRQDLERNFYRNLLSQLFKGNK